MSEETVRMTPKKVAQLLVYNWFTCSGESPFSLDCEEMSVITKDFNYTITEKRRLEILRQVEKMTEPLRQKCAEALIHAGLDV